MRIKRYSFVASLGGFIDITPISPSYETFGSVRYATGFYEFQQNFLLARTSASIKSSCIVQLGTS